MKHLKLGQITDLHLRSHLPGSPHIPARHSRTIYNLFKSALGVLQREKCDLIVITGDLIDAPHYLSQYNLSEKQWWQHAHDAAKNDYLLIRDALEKTGIPYIAIPGNHDDALAFYAVFPKKKQNTVKGWNVYSFHDWEDENNQPRRESKEWQLWEDALTCNRPQIHLQHYVTRPELNESYPYNYPNAQPMVEKMKNASQLIVSLAGHYHDGSNWQQEGRALFTVCPAFGEFPYRYRIYHLNETDPADNKISNLQLSVEDEPLHKAIIVSFPENRFISPEQLLDPSEVEVLTRCNQADYSITLLSAGTMENGLLRDKHSVDLFLDQCSRILENAGLIVDGVFPLNRGNGNGLTSEGLGKLIQSLRYKPEQSFFLSKREEHLQMAQEHGFSTFLLSNGAAGMGCNLVTACESILSAPQKLLL